MSCQITCGFVRGALVASVLFSYGFGALVRAHGLVDPAATQDTTSSTAEKETEPDQNQGGFEATDQPPWQSSADTPRLLSEPFENPRQLLRLLDIGSSQLESFVDGQALGDEDQEALIRVLYRLPQVDLASIHRWQTSQIPWQELVDDPATLRASYYLLRGHVSQIQKETLSTRLSELFEFDHYYRVVLESTETNHRLVVCAREIPNAWKDRTALRERVRVSAMFLKLGASSDDSTELIFAAQRVAWLPDHVDVKHGIDESHLVLGNLDMDVGLFEFARKRNRLPIGDSERECFYELLSATGKTTAEQLAKVTEPMELASLLQTPENWHGRVVEIQGNVRRITHVLVDEADIRERFGIDSYFQLDVLVPLGDQRIEFQNKLGKADGPVYRNSFPFTFCVAELPESWREFVGKDRMNERMTTRGFFFKLWSFPSAYVAAYDTNQRQLSPMFIALQPGSPKTASASDTTSGWMLGAGFLAVLGFLWIAVWRLNRSDRKFLREQVRHRFDDDSAVSLDNLNQD